MRLCCSTAAQTARGATAPATLLQRRGRASLTLSGRPPHVCAIEFIDGLLALILVRHLNEAEATRSACVAVHNDRCGIYRSKLSEHFLEFGIVRAERKVPYIDVHFSIFLNWRSREHLSRLTRSHIG